MKSIFKVSLIVFASISILGSCSSNDENGTGQDLTLPAQARSFVSQYFSGYNYAEVDHISTNERGSAYKAILREGVEIEFDKNGLWTDIDGNGRALPQSILDILPLNIVSYVLGNHPSTSIEEIERKNYGFKVELLNDADLLFDKAGEYLSSQANAENNGSAVESVLPQNVRTLILTHFSTESFLYIAEVKQPVVNNTVYNIYLTNGYKLKFDSEGSWSDFEAENRPLPKSLIREVLPEKVTSDLDRRYPNIGVESIEKKSTYYEIELLNDVDLTFGFEGNYLGSGEGRDNQHRIEPTSLPQTAINLITAHFPSGGGYRYIIKNTLPDDGVTYEIFLNDETKLELDIDGSWLEVESKRKSLPQSFINTLPAGIVNYLNNNKSNVGVKEVSKERYGYEISLLDGYELEFDLNGILTQIDK